MPNKKDEMSGGATPNESSTPAEEQAGSDPRNTEKSAQRAARSNEEAASRSMERSMEAGRQATEQATRQTAELGRQATEQTAQLADRGLRQAADMARQQGEQARNLMLSSSEAYRDLTEYSRADFDAMLQSGTRLAQGLQEMGWQMSNLTQETLRLSMRLANELMGCRTVEDLVAAQRDFVKDSVDAFLAGSARMLSMSSKVASDAVTPINERVGDGGFEGAGRGGESTEAPEHVRGAAPRSRESSGREYRH